MRQRVAALLLLAGCRTGVDYVTGRTTLNHYTLEEEVDLGTRMATVFLASTEALGLRQDPDDAFTPVVRRVLARLLEVPENRARMPPFPWELHVVEAADANAWSFAGGQVVVATGLLQSGGVQNEHELALILGHELAHVAGRHWSEKQTLLDLERRLQPLGRFLGSRLVELAQPESPRELIRALEQGGPGYDQAQELEADLVGLELLARAGYDPALAPAVWGRLAARDGAAAGLGGSHPAHSTRARELSRHVAAARWVAARRRSALPPLLASWTWSIDQGGAPRARRSLAEQGALPLGRRLEGLFLEPGPELLELRCAPLGRRCVLRAARELVEDGLPCSGEWWWSQQGRPPAPQRWAPRSLRGAADLTLGPGEPGATLEARARVGALEARYPPRRPPSPR